MTTLTLSKCREVMDELSSFADTLDPEDADLIQRAMAFIKVARDSGQLIDDRGAVEPVEGSMSELQQLAIQMRELQIREGDIKIEAAEVRSSLDQIRLRRIPDMMIALELRNATFKGLGRIQLAQDLYASTKAGKKEEAMTWLSDAGYEGMIKPSVNASSLKALFRRMIEAGEPIPDEIFSVTPFTRASIVKA